MSKNKIFLIAFTLLLASLLLAACGGAAPEAPAEPTFDSSLLYTAAAMTVQADMTEQALNNPTETPMPSATLEAMPATALPTFPPAGGAVQATIDPNAAPVLNTPAVALPARGTPAAPILLVTPTLPLATPADQASWIANNPSDGSSIKMGSSFDMVWSIRNTGATTWTTEYTYQYWGGSTDCSLYPAAKTYYLTAPVPPGEKVRLKVPMTAPNNKGTCSQTWVMVNADGQAFLDSFYVSLEITD